LALPPTFADSVDNPAISRAAHSQEFIVLPQIESAAGRHLSRVMLQHTGDEQEQRDETS
jgi:hypothetical protein